jgi:hypothetical protein
MYSVWFTVTDSVEYQIEQREKIKTGNYINSEWICDDCLGAERKGHSSSHTNQNNNSNDSQRDDIATASKSDVSPNTPKADEANL